MEKVIVAEMKDDVILYVPSLQAVSHYTEGCFLFTLAGSMRFFVLCKDRQVI